MKNKTKVMKQAIDAAPEEIEPLLCEVRPEGLFICTGTATEYEGLKLLERIANL